MSMVMTEGDILLGLRDFSLCGLNKSKKLSYFVSYSVRKKHPL